MKTFVNIQRPKAGRTFTLPMLILCALALIISQPAKAALPDTTANYAIQVVEPPPGNVVDMWWTFINESGLLVSQYFIDNPSDPLQVPQGHTAVLDKGVWTVIDVPGSAWCGGSVPSASGRVGLTYVLADDPEARWHTAIYHKGTYTPLPEYIPLPRQPAYQFGIQSISDHGLMAGMIFDPAVDPDGVIGRQGLLFNASLSVFRTFSYPGAVTTTPFGMNNAGLVVGTARDSNGTRHGFVYDGRTFKEVNVPGATAVYVDSINNRGDIVGSFTDGEGVMRGFLLLRGNLAVFEIPNSSLTSVDQITDKGQISGEYFDLDWMPHCFIATPIAGRK